MANDCNDVEPMVHSEREPADIRRIRRVGWIGNFLLSIGIVLVGVIFESPQGALIGYWAGVPGGIVTFDAAVNRWPRLRGTSWSNPGGCVVALLLSLLAVSAVAVSVGAPLMLLAGLLVWASQFAVARAFAARRALAPVATRHQATPPKL